MSRANETRANALLAVPRKLLDEYLREAADRLARRREIVGTRIREAREAAGLKQKQLAARVHVEPQTVSNWERSVSIPDLDKIEALALELGRPVSFFYAETPEIKDESAVTRLAAEVAEIHALLLGLAEAQGLDVAELLHGAQPEPEEHQPADEGLEPPAAAGQPG